MVDARDYLTELGVHGTAYAAPVKGGGGVGFDATELVAPASVMKIQIALTVENLIAEGSLDGLAQRHIPVNGRTPGPTGISLMADEVSMSVRDLVVSMITISDNGATDELLGAVGLDQVNRTTLRLGLSNTRIASDVRSMLDAIARDVGFSDYLSLVAYDSKGPAGPSDEEIVKGIALSPSLDPRLGTRTTALDAVTLLQAIWTDGAGPPEACSTLRRMMDRQLTRSRIASGFQPPVQVAAKSGGLLGVVRNEAGVVTFPGGPAYAVAVFTRRDSHVKVDPAKIDGAIGRVALSLVSQLHSALA